MDMITVFLATSGTIRLIPLQPHCYYQVRFREILQDIRC